MFLAFHCVMIGISYISLATFVKQAHSFQRIGSFRNIVQYKTRVFMSSCSKFPENTVIVLSGATGSGKSKLALSLCERLNGEIVVADCIQVLKHASIGCTKPTEIEQQRVPHHLVGYFETDNQVSGGEFARVASIATKEILSRGKTPVIVGGSSMWIDWLVHGIPDNPKSDPNIRIKVRDQIENYRVSGDWDEALSILMPLDRKRAESLSRNDWIRLQRALEISFQKQEDALHGESRSGKAPGSKIKMLDGLDIRSFFLIENREQLYQNTDKRCVEMMSLGLLDEVYNLLINGHIMPRTSLARSIGYYQVLKLFCSSLEAPINNQCFLSFLSDFTSATRNYAKRQMQWARRDSSVMWLLNDRGLSPSVMTGLKRSRDKEESGVGASFLADNDSPLMDTLARYCLCSPEEYRQAASYQCQMSKEISNLRQMKRLVVDDEQLTIPEKRRALAHLISLNEIKLRSSDDSTSLNSASSQSWQLNIQNSQNGITPSQITAESFGLDNYIIRAQESKETVNRLKAYTFRPIYHSLLNTEEKISVYAQRAELLSTQLKLSHKNSLQDFAIWFQDEEKFASLL